MSRYSDLQKQIQELTKQAEAIRQTEKAEAISKIKSLIAEHGITAPEIFHKNNKGNVSPPKYRDPNSAATWGGRGRAPHWAVPYRDAGTLAQILIK